MCASVYMVSMCHTYFPFCGTYATSFSTKRQDGINVIFIVSFHVCTSLYVVSVHMCVCIYGEHVPHLLPIFWNIKKNGFSTEGQEKVNAHFCSLLLCMCEPVCSERAYVSIHEFVCIYSERAPYFFPFSGTHETSFSTEGQHRVSVIF